VKVRFLGGVRTVTGSMHLVETEGGNLLLECGLFQGHREEAFQRNRHLPAPAKSARAVILSHAHIDHSGALPNLVKSGWKGAIHATRATAELCDLMLRDSGAIQERDADFLNRHRKERKGDGAVEPLYTVEDAVAALRRFKAHGYGEEFEPIPGVTARFADAGHILGSAVIHLTVREKSGTTRLVFTGDLGRKGMPLVRDPEPAGPAEVVLTESTYGDRDHEPPEDTERRLFEVVDATARRGGRVIVPSFAVGRAQAIIYLLHRLRAAGKLQDVPIYVDSPMAVDATQIFARNSGLFDEEAREFLAGRGRLFTAARTTYVSDTVDSKRLNEIEGPAVILSASGMCEAGRVLHHLRHGLEDARNTVLFVGYQAEHTLGRRILEGADEVKVFGELHAVRAQVAKLNGLSAHADRGGIAEYLKSLGPRPKRLFLVHGDLERCEALKGFLAARGLPGAEVPEPRQAVDLADSAAAR
jgi:metallo-beta-lactamase family protein